MRSIKIFDWFASDCHRLFMNVNSRGMHRCDKNRVRKPDWMSEAVFKCSMIPTKAGLSEDDTTRAGVSENVTCPECNQLFKTSRLITMSI